MRSLQSIILIPFLFCCIDLYAQNTEDTLNKKNTLWTISANMYSLPYLYSHDVAPLDIQPHFFTGLVVERDFEFLSTRAGFEYFKIDIPDEKPGCCDIPLTTGYQQQSLYKIGVEKEMVLTKHIRPYLATELASIIMHSNVTFMGGFSPQYYNIKVNTKSLGFLQTLGFQFSFNNALSLSVEHRLALTHYQSKIDHYNFDQNTSSTYTRTGSMLSFNPISALMLNVHF